MPQGWEKPSGDGPDDLYIFLRQVSAQHVKFVRALTHSYGAPLNEQFQSTLTSIALEIAFSFLGTCTVRTP